MDGRCRTSGSSRIKAAASILMAVKACSQFIMDFACDPGPLFFAYALQPGGQRAQLLERMLQFLFRLHALGYVHDRTNEFEKVTGFVSRMALSRA